MQPQLHCGVEPWSPLQRLLPPGRQGGPLDPPLDPPTEWPPLPVEPPPAAMTARHPVLRTPAVAVGVGGKSSAGRPGWGRKVKLQVGRPAKVAVKEPQSAPLVRRSFSLGIITGTHPGSCPTSLISCLRARECGDATGCIAGSCRRSCQAWTGPAPASYCHRRPPHAGSAAPASVQPGGCPGPPAQNI